MNMWPMTSVISLRLENLHYIIGVLLKNVLPSEQCKYTPLRDDPNCYCHDGL